jgi:hypothetical protein
VTIADAITPSSTETHRHFQFNSAGRGSRESGDTGARLQVQYRLPRTPDAVMFQVGFSWRFSPRDTMFGPGRVTPGTSIELMMEKSTLGRRDVWGLRWSSGDGYDEYRQVSHTWKVWNGERWHDTRITQRLSPDRWHFLQLQGDVLGDYVRYMHLVSADLSRSLGQRYLSEGGVCEGGEEPTMSIRVAVRTDDGHLEPEEACDSVLGRVSFVWAPLRVRRHNVRAS